MKKILIILLSIFLALGVFLIGGYFFYLKPIKVLNVSYEIDEYVITAMVEISQNVTNPICIIKDKEVRALNHKCVLEVPNEETIIQIKSPFETISYSLIPNINQILDFTLKDTKIYLALGDTKEVVFSLEKLGNPKEDITLTSENEGIVAVNQNVIKGLSVGNTLVHAKVGNITKEIEVIVTDLIMIPQVITKKPKLTCGVYSEEQNKLLDTILEYRVNQAGFKTRAGVVAALRFLTLEFPYQLSYFYESGRLNNNTGGNYVDGEGRFYHKGLYLNTVKYQELLKTKYGPATWGCPLMNWQEEAGFLPGVRYPNGLDCSGFISWVFFNGGFDVLDTGAGDNPWTDDDLSDLGPHTPITRDVLTNGKLKAGDIIATDGHIAMVGGIKDGIIYVGESTTYYKGVVMHPYTIEELLQTDYLTYVIYMDDYYKEMGQYQEYWS